MNRINIYFYSSKTLDMIIKMISSVYKNWYVITWFYRSPSHYLTIMIRMEINMSKDEICLTLNLMASMITTIQYEQVNMISNQEWEKIIFSYWLSLTILQEFALLVWHVKGIVWFLLFKKKISTVNNDEKKNYSMHLCQSISFGYISYNFI